MGGITEAGEAIRIIAQVEGSGMGAGFPDEAAAASAAARGVSNAEEHAGARSANDDLETRPDAEGELARCQRSVPAESCARPALRAQRLDPVVAARRNHVRDARPNN